MEMSSHCAIEVQENILFLVDFNLRTFFLNTTDGSFEELEPLITGLNSYSDIACNLAPSSLDNGESDDVIILANTKVTEIFNVQRREWRKGDAIDFDFRPLVDYADSFVAIGGT